MSMIQKIDSDNNLSSTEKQQHKEKKETGDDDREGNNTWSTIERDKQPKTQKISTGPDAVVHHPLSTAASSLSDIGAGWLSIAKT